jgi:hypothetical protein
MRRATRAMSLTASPGSMSGRYTSTGTRCSQAASAAGTVIKPPVTSSPSGWKARTSLMASPNPQTKSNAFNGSRQPTP